MDSIEIKSAKLSSAKVSEATGTHIERQLNSRADIGNAHKFFSPGAETHAAAASITTVPGADSAGLAALAGAKDPISPIVQMIMRLPGHIGLLNSFFDALQAMFLPHSDLLSGFDPSVLGAHATTVTNGSLMSGSEHSAIDPAILPPEAHVMDGLGTGLNVDLSLKTAWHMNMHSDSSKFFNNSLNVAGQPDINNAIYEQSTSGLNGIEKASIDEQTGGILAGPSISQSATGSHLAGSHPIFSKELFDRAGVQSNGAMLASAPQNLTQPQAAIQASQLSASNALYVSGNPITQHISTAPTLADSSALGVNGGATNAAFSFVPRSGLNLNGQGSGAQQTFGPSGAVSDNLGTRNVLNGNDELASNFHPSTLSNAGQTDFTSQQSTSSPIKEVQSSSNQPHAALKGLQAQELSLDGHHMPKLSSTHHASTVHPAGSHKAGPSSSHTASKPSPFGSPKPAIAKPDSASQTSDGGKASAVASEQDQVAVNDHAAAPTSTDQIPLETGTHTVQTGDSLWKVAEERLGDATRWPDIYKLNMDKIGTNPDLIHPGLKLDLPEHAQDIATPTQSTSDYVVKAGDNLWDISKSIYGDGTHWGQIYHANADTIGSNPRLIFPGEKLSLPSDGSTTIAQASATSAASPIHASTPAAGHATQVANASHIDSPIKAAQPAPHPTAHTATVASQTTSVAANAPKVAFSGPGSAGAETLSELKTTAGEAPIVSPSLAPDLSYFARKR
jgi:nucleoid-associated protein YgaU